MGKRSFTNAIHVSKLAGQDHAMALVLEAVPNYRIQAMVDAGSTAAQILGVVPAGVYVTSIINHVALTGGTVAVVLRDPAGVDSDIDVSPAAFDLDTAAESTADAFLTPTDKDLYLVATVTGGTAGETAILGLNVGVLKPEWS